MPSGLSDSYDEHSPELGGTPLVRRLSPYNTIKINEAVARCVMESDSVGLLLCSKEGVIREANDALLSMVQHSRSDIQNGTLTWQDLTPPEMVARDYEIGRQVLKGGMCPPFEKQYVRRDGSRIDVLVISSRVYGSEEFQVVTLVFDLSERKRAGELAAANVFLDTLFENMPSILYVKDAKTLQYIRFNKAFEEICACPHEEIFGKTDLELFPEKIAAHLATLDRRLLTSGEPLEISADPFDSDEGVRFYYSKRLLIRNPDGTPSYILGITEDVTEKREADEKRLAFVREQTRREEAERVASRLQILAGANTLVTSSLDYQETLQNLARSVVPLLADWCTVEMFTPEGVRETIVMEHVFGSDPGTPDLLKFYKEPTEDESRRALEIVREGPRYSSAILPEDLHLFTRDPEERRILEKIGLVSYISIPLDLRRSTLGVFTLVTTRHSNRRYSESDFHLVQELARNGALAIDNARLYQKSQNLHRAKDEFLAMLSHELRTPLSVIHGFAEILKNDGAHLAEEERQEYYDIIFRNAEHQARIVTDLLDVTALITGKMSFQPHGIPAAQAVSSVIQNLLPAAEAKGISLIFRDEGAPDAIYGDPTRFQQIVCNLISNSVKFTPSGGEVTITIAKKQDKFVLVVADTGLGMDADFLPYVFDRFRQEDGSVTRRFGGLGLGLAIVRHLVDLHRGTIKAESEGKGKGARFTVTLPLSEPVIPPIP